MDDLLWMEDMATSRPTPSQQVQVTEFLAWVEWYVKPRCLVQSRVGYPVFARREPGPSSMIHQLYGEFFEAPFAVWLREDNET